MKHYLTYYFLRYRAFLYRFYEQKYFFSGSAKKLSKADSDALKFFFSSGTNKDNLLFYLWVQKICSTILYNKFLVR